MTTKIPKNHPRYQSLITRNRISEATKNGIVHDTGLIAHGRGEAFDYLLGEKTIETADEAAKAAAAQLILAKNPVISVNGNAAALSAKECVKLSELIPAKIEINLFHREETRIKKISELLVENGAEKVYGLNSSKRIKGLDHDRALCEQEGIFSADVVLVPLEDGDRCRALRDMGKIVITIDLNPLSRTAKTANITIVDNITRALPNISNWIKKIKKLEKNEINDIILTWNNKKNLKKTLDVVSKRLNSIQ